MVKFWGTWPLPAWLHLCVTFVLFVPSGVELRTTILSKARRVFLILFWKYCRVIFPAAFMRIKPIVINLATWHQPMHHLWSSRWVWESSKIVFSVRYTCFLPGGENPLSATMLSTVSSKQKKHLTRKKRKKIKRSPLRMTLHIQINRMLINHRILMVSQLDIFCYWSCKIVCKLLQDM